MAAAEYLRRQLEKFLLALDSVLDEEASVIVIGGTAVILGYGIERGTTDIDWWMSASKELQEKWKVAVEKSGVSVKLDTAGVAQGPEDFESRLKRLSSPKLEKLKIFYPEAHDLAIMKICRNMDVDAEDIDALHASVQLDSQILLKRFLEELTYIGSQNDIDLKYLLTIERLFGEAIADSHQTTLKKRRAR
ncbi:MAG: hypothetical protein KF799_06020 [Bdellovibrionales bacterium]|nr:hypothetical protein [Bdellovibrionales bacterium]